jgi:hypothetical protein
VNEIVWTAPPLPIRKCFSIPRFIQPNLLTLRRGNQIPRGFTEKSGDDTNQTPVSWKYFPVPLGLQFTFFSCNRVFVVVAAESL